MSKCKLCIKFGPVSVPSGHCVSLPLRAAGVWCCTKWRYEKIVLQYSRILSEKLTGKEFLVIVPSLELEGNIGCGYTSYYFDCVMYLRTLDRLFFVYTRSRSSVFCMYEMQVTSVSWGCDLSRDFTIYCQIKFVISAFSVR